MSRVIVTGGGASGMMAAAAAAGCGHHVTLYEKNERLGKKLYITGKGRCNVTNGSDVQELLGQVLRNPKFLYSALYAFDSFAMMDFLEEAGLPLKIERGNRVFPKSDKSSDVIRTLARVLSERGVKVHLRTEVESVLVEDGRLVGVSVHTQKGEETVLADAVIVATGGLSYPSTGSTGDGYRFAGETGHRLEKTVPCLVPFTVEEEYICRMQGLSLKNVELTLKDGDRRLFREFGELLFTHFGVSGPLVLSASSTVSGMDLSGVAGEIDLKPALSEKQLDDRILRDFGGCRNSYFKNSLGKLLPSKMIPVIVELSGILPEKKAGEVTRQERKRLVQCLKAFPFTVSGLRGYDEAIVTRGGVSLRDINPATMESRRVPGLYFVGEVLDVDGKTGGYNLQIAWSTGNLAGISVQ